MLAVLLLLLASLSFGATGATSKSEDDPVKQLERQMSATLKILDSVADQLQVKDLNDFEACDRWRESVYRIARKQLTVDKDGWILVGEGNGELRYMKLDEFCNVHEKLVKVDTSIPLDTSLIERSAEIPDAPSYSSETPAGYVFVGFLLVAISAIFLLYGTVSALMRKQLVPAFARGFMFFVLVVIGYYLLKGMV